jgi:hypothetical protein
MYNNQTWTQELAGHTRDFLEVVLTHYGKLLSTYFAAVDFVVSDLFDDIEEEDFLDNVQEDLEKEKADCMEAYDKSAAYALESTQIAEGSFVVTGFWFVAFFLVFSHLSAPTASNEYLLLGCILFTIFAAYGQLATILEGAIAPATLAIRGDASHSVNLATDANTLRADAYDLQLTDVDSTEQLSVTASAEVDETTQADEITVEQAVTSVATQSLHSAVVEELTDEMVEEVLEEIEMSETLIEQVLEEFFEDN